MNRLSDGRLLVDFLAETFSLPYLPPYQNHSANFSQGVNFAIAGSTVLPKDYFVRNKVGHTLMWKAVPESLQTQVEWYINFFEEQQQSECNRKEERSCMAELEDVLFWIGDMGVNDYARNFGTSVSVHSLAQRIVQNVMKLLKTLLDRGAKYIVIQGLPPTGCLPLDLFLSPASDRDETGCAAGANLVVAAHNDLLQRKLVDLEKQYPHCAIIYADYWNAFLTILKNPAQFGFSEPFKTCCGTGAGILNFDLHSLCGSPGASRCTDPTKHINWDGVHPTEAMNQKLANLLFDQGFCRPSFGQLIRYKKCT
ncbi:PREDICTED: GDSL esterase/lipase At3g48460-like [Nelumbo nucifera]|nr:PREDICTED: GDSL esterase/lipase At3g48460-like [Nelumbo nucifera]